MRPAMAALSLAAALSLTLTACGQSTPAAGPPGGGMPPAEVGVVTVTPGELGLVSELPGRLEASRVAQVRARAAGILQKRLFREGSDVRAGQPLFEIDAAPYRATFESAQATQAKAEANLAQASALAERYKPLAEAKAISQQEFVAAQAAQKQAQADVAVAKAAVQTARINLDYANVSSPINGRIGRALVTEGALVGQGEATQLAVVQQIDPIYVNFTQSAGDVMKLRRALEAGQLKRAGTDAATVRVMLEDGTEYARPGKLLFSDLTVGQHHRPGDAARRSAQPRWQPAAWPVRAREAGTGQGQQRHHAAPASGDTQRAGRQRDGGGPRWQGGPTPRQGGCPTKRAMGDPGRSDSWRPSHG
jgi:membrane fusion protein (multidrug efflux system)